jgi:hypothetical protein
MAVMADLGFREIGEFSGVFDIWPRGERLRKIRAAAERYKQRFKEQGVVRSARTIDIATAPYITSYAFHGAAKTVNPYVSITNRMAIVSSRTSRASCARSCGSRPSRTARPQRPSTRS